MVVCAQVYFHWGKKPLDLVLNLGVHRLVFVVSNVTLLSSKRLGRVRMVKNKLSTHFALWWHIQIWIFILGDSSRHSEMHIFFGFWIPASQFLFVWGLTSLSPNLLRCCCLIPTGSWSLLLIYPVEVVSSSVLPFIRNCFNRGVSAYFFITVNFYHSNFSFFFVSNDRSFLNRPF